MSNHVEHDMYIEGKLEDVKEFHEWIKPFIENEGKGISANLVPFPPEREIINKKATELHRADWFNSGGYEWCCNNWGSKWGIYSLQVVEEPNDYGSDFSSGIYCFNTAWSPSLPLYRKLAEKFPKLEIRITYFERGAEFHGFYEFKEGELKEHKEAEYYGSRGG